MTEPIFVEKKARLAQLQARIELKVAEGDLDAAESLSLEMVQVAESEASHVLVSPDELYGLAPTKPSLLPALRSRKGICGIAAVTLLGVFLALLALFSGGQTATGAREEAVPTYSQHLLESTGRQFRISSHSEAEHYSLIHSYLKAYGSKLFASPGAQMSFMHDAQAFSRQMIERHPTVPDALREAPNALIGRQLDQVATKARS